MTALRDVLYPELRRWPAAQRERVWRQARSVPFDVLELLGIAVGMLVVTALSAYGTALLVPPERAVATLANLIIALPLLALFVGPFLVRRTRRALQLAAGGIG